MKILNQSRSEGRALRKLYLTRSKEIIKERQDRIHERDRLHKETEEKKLQEKENLTDEIIYYGLWQAPSRVDREMKELLTVTQKTKALTVQLKFRKLVLQQTHEDPTIFNTSVINKQKVTLAQLINNVKCLIVDASHQPSQQLESHDIPPLVGKDIRHYFETDGVKTSYEGHVINTVPGFPTWYNCFYRDDADVYTYQLAKDYRNKDLEVLGTDVVPVLLYQFTNYITTNLRHKKV
jgi:hypothetical protein